MRLRACAASAPSDASHTITVVSRLPAPHTIGAVKMQGPVLLPRRACTPNLDPDSDEPDTSVQPSAPRRVAGDYEYVRALETLTVHPSKKAPTQGR